jgi:hypothetical protein
MTDKASGRLRPRFWVEAGTAIASGLLAVVTLFWKDWIEVTGWDPDNHSGSAEWLVVAALAAVSVVTAVLARVEWRRHAVATA